MPPTPWPSDRARTFARLWRQGASAEVIAQATNIKPSSVPSVAVRLRRWGYVVPHRRGGHPPWTPDRVAPIARAIARGTDVSDLARLMGVAEQSVSQTVHRLRAQGVLPPGPRLL